MDKEMLRRVQLTQLEIAKEFRKICDENNLQYMLEGGSLIGAVRHHGFIPWDDDMDFSMPREDYDKFFSIASQMTESKFVPVRWDMTEGYPHPFGKFVKRGTVYREEKMDQSYGIYIDIFPWDHVPTEDKVKAKYRFKMMIYRAIMRAKCGCRTYRVNGKFVLTKFLKNIPFMIIAPFFSKNRLIAKYDKMATEFNNTETEFVCLQDDGKVYNWNTLKSNLEEFAEYEFEGSLFKGPLNYDDYLTGGYGNYMQLPPIEERGNQHLIVELDFGE